MRVGNAELRPVDFTCQLLSSKWKLPEGEGDVTVMRVEVSGRSGGVAKRHIYDLMDRYDPESQITSMARTTGFPCAVVGRLILDGTLKLPAGVHFPEVLASHPGPIERLLSELASRNIVFRHRVESR